MYSTAVNRLSNNMNKTRLVRNLVVYGAVLSLAAGNFALAQAPVEGTAKVFRVSGPARFSTGNDVWQPLKEGYVLKPGAVVETGKDAFVDIALGDADLPVPTPVSFSTTVSGAGGSGAGGGAGGYTPQADQNIVRVHSESRVAIDKLLMTDTGAGVVTQTQLDLQKGKIFGNVKKISAGSEYFIKLPLGVAGIRGTIYTISADGVVAVLAGSAVISYQAPNGQMVTVTVSGGYQFDARTGQVVPIPDYDRSVMVKDAKEARIGPNTPPQSFTHDQTVYYVSPTTGHNGNGIHASNGP
jgi:hypothetical protein